MQAIAAFPSVGIAELGWCHPRDGDELTDGLEHEKLITRQPHPVDRRMLKVHMTEKGRELMSEILPDHFCRIKDWMENLSDREKKLINLLAKLRFGIPALQE
jgi:DNA-binding MarR family transcriptional regulator